MSYVYAGYSISVAVFVPYCASLIIRQRRMRSKRGLK
jgi:hypothetical protein